MRSSSNVPDTPTVLLFLKAPRLGYVKTRLAESIGSESALHIYRTLVERQLTQLSSSCSIEIHFTPEDAVFEMRQWLGDTHRLYSQCTGGLGLRLTHAVTHAFDRGARQVICIGGDCPKLNRTHFEQTAAALQGDCDVVFGPSEDGGYYLIGLNAPYLELFQNIPWSTSTTLDESLKQTTALKLRVKLLDTLYDIDEVAELNRAISDGLLPVDLVKGYRL